ncbi:MAG: hypothetical protein JSR79_06225 [Proteobacteria bacterium]|nr:hypothetical protein [Pseudomonadota bacterium]
MVTARFPLSEADRVLVSDAVTAAEAGTDGEIVTVITQRSAEYRDTALICAAMAMLLVVALAAVAPGWIDAMVSVVDGGWGDAPSASLRFVALLSIEAALFGLTLLLFRLRRLRLVLTPPAVRARRVRARAIRYFKVGAEKRTAARVGVLLYLSLDERLAEIVADAAIHAQVQPERWGDAMVALVDEVRADRSAHGMAAAVAAIGAIVAEHFPKTEDDRNELPDRLIEL